MRSSHTWYVPISFSPLFFVFPPVLFYILSPLLILFVQVQAEYWHDPLNVAEYLAKCVFLPDINNDLPSQNATYKKNFMSLNHLALVQFTEDTIVQPKESEVRLSSLSLPRSLIFSLRSSTAFVFFLLRLFFNFSSIFLRLFF